ncbi:MAG: contractile injection system tape measure protein [Balneolaceae bacterium]
MSDQQHIVKRQILEVELQSGNVTGTGNGQRMQEKISEIYRSRVIPVLEKTLDRLSDANNNIAVERLEIDVGELNFNRLTELFPDRVEDALYQVLNDKIRSYKLEDELKRQGIQMQPQEEVTLTVRSPAEAKAEKVVTFLRTGRMPWNAGTGENRKRFSQLLEELLEEDPLEAARVLRTELKRTLQKRRFILQTPDAVISKALTVSVDPAQSGHGKQKRIEQLTGFARKVESVSRREGVLGFGRQNKLRFVIWSSVIPIALEETGQISMSDQWLADNVNLVLQKVFVHQAEITIPPRKVFGLLNKIAAESSISDSGDSGKTGTGAGTETGRIVGPLIRQFQERFERRTDPKHDRRDEVQSDTERSREQPEEAGRDTDTDEHNFDGASDEEAEWLDSGADGKNREEGEAASDDEIKTSGKSDRNQSRPGDQTGAEDQTAGIHPGQEGKGEPISGRASEKSGPSLANGSGEGDEEIHRSYPVDQEAGEAWIQNAGLVLMYPFLVSLFERTHLVKDKQFVNQQAQERGVHLLEYLVSGRQETPEEELFLNKLLCGLDPEFPVPPAIEITEQEDLECDKLLKDVIRQWKALKNTSPAALRSTFLQREGLVTREGLNGGWKIVIERNSFDVLLDKLPWGISIFKMPWNSFLIHVEW